ncbi:MAG: hypothetical protein M0037_02240 [Betaproteobacteria bacterium]|nr:hypothetical protein [Betaproteobacteria bacterium]
MTFAAVPPPTVTRVRAMIRADLARRLALEGRPPTFARILGVLPRPGGAAVVLFRVNQLLHARGLRLLSKLAELVMFYWARVEIHPGAQIGAGLVLPDVGGVGIPAFARIGERCTLTGPALLTIGGMEGVDLAKDRIVLGDDCVLGPGVRILGAVVLADGTQVKANAVVITSATRPGTVLAGVPARRRGSLPLGAIRQWNPLRGEPLSGASSVPPKPETASAIA